MMNPEAVDFSRVRVFGVEYLCSCGKALANRWDPMPKEDEKAEIQEVVCASGRVYRVEALIDGIFSKSVIRSVSIPNTVRSLPDKCFEFCEHLVTVTCESDSQINSFGVACFKRCGLSEIEVPDSCISIGRKCFDGCSRLCHVGFSERSQLERLGNFAFRGCEISDLYLPSDLVIDRETIFLGVKSVRVENNRNVVMSNDCLISQDRRILFHCFSSNPSCEVPDSIRKIRAWCFAGSNVRRVVFGTYSSVKDLEGAFSGSAVEEIVFQRKHMEYFCKDGMLLSHCREYTVSDLHFRLSRDKSMEIHSDVKVINSNFCGASDPLTIVRFDPDCKEVKISKAAFKDTGITEIFIHGVEAIPSKCFYRCICLKDVSFSRFSTVKCFGKKSFSMSCLEQIYVPKSVERISRKCFCGCKLLKEVSFEEGSRLQQIDEKAFMNTSLARLIVPSGVDTVVGTSFFGVHDIVFNDDSVLSISDAFLIHTRRQCLVSFLGGASDDVVIPSKIRVVGSQSFYRCGHIKSLSFEEPSEVVSIESDAFKYCHIDRLHIPERLSNVDRNVLSHVSSVFVDEGNRCFDLHNNSFLTRVLGDQSISLLGVTGADDVIHVPDYVSDISSVCGHGNRGFVLSFPSNDLCEMCSFGPGAFKGSDIVSVNFPPKTESIQDSCFENCALLLNVSFHGCNLLKSLGNSCFAGTSIFKVTIPCFLEVLASKAFSGCVHLVEVAFEENSQLRVIGESCFSDCIGVRVLELPDSVRVIQSYAFRNSRISEFKFPPLLNELGGCCFGRHLTTISSLCELGIQTIRWRCFSASQLKSVEIPALILTIEHGAFEDCSMLETVIFETGSRLQTIGSHAFCGTSISEILFPSTLQSIGAEAFRRTKLREVCLPKGLQELGSRAFADCALLRSVSFENGSVIRIIKGRNVFKGTTGCHITIPESVVKFEGTFLPIGCSVTISEENTSYVCDEHFVYSKDRNRLVRCFNAEASIVIPRTVKCIDKFCFEGPTIIRSISFEEGSKLKKIQTHAFVKLELSTLTLPNGIKSLLEAASFRGPGLFWKCCLGTLAFEEESQLKEIDLGIGDVDTIILPKGVKEIYVPDTKSGHAKHVAIDSRNKYFFVQDHFILEKKKRGLVFLCDMEVVDVVVPKFVRILRCRCFSGGSQVRNITFESDSDLHVIERGGVGGTSIERFVVPRLVEEIEDGAFYDCKFLKDLVFEEECVIRSLTCGMFDETTLDSLFISSNVEYVEPGSLYGIKHISISPKNPHLHFGSEIFQAACTGISKLGSITDGGTFVFHSNVEMIPDSEFCENEQIEEVVFPPGALIRSIGQCSFRKTSLRSISIPQSVESLGVDCFSFCEKLTCVTFVSGSRLTSLPNACFTGASIESISIPSAIQTIEGGCFGGSRLRNIRFAQDSCLTRVESYAFRKTHLVSVVLPRSVVFLGESCFEDCEHLSSFSFEDGSNLEHIGARCFDGSKLDEIVIPMKVRDVGPGSLTGIRHVDIDPRNPNFYFDEPFLFSIDGSTIKAYFSNMSEVTVPDFVKVIGDDCFSNSYISCVHFASESRLVVIGDRAFYSTSVSSFVVPRSVQTIGKECFKKSSDLSVVGFATDSELREIGAECFCSTGVAMMDFRKVPNVTRLESGLFMDSNLAKVIISRNIEQIDEKCFCNTKFLSEVLFEDNSNLRCIECSAFEQSAIQAISLPNHLETIGDKSFCNCINLREVTFANLIPLRSLSKSLFEKSSISSIRIPEAVVSIEESCFKDCESLSDLIFPDECSLEEIGSHAFKHSTLESVILPRNLRRIGDECFADCSKLERLKFSDGSIRVIDSRDVFKGVQECMICLPDCLRRFPRKLIPDGCFVSISPGNPTFASDGQFIFNSRRDKLLWCLNHVYAVTIPRYVRVIRRKCFQDPLLRNEINFEPSSCLDTIEPYAFQDFVLERVVLPRSVRCLRHAFKTCVIGRLEFEEGCEIEHIDYLGCRIHELVVPSKTKSIDENTLRRTRRVILACETSSLSVFDHFLLEKEKKILVFMFDMEVVDVVVPRFVRVLKSQCFLGRENVDSITFESGSELRVIESYALQGTSVGRFVVPRLVEKIEQNAFCGCKLLHDLIFEEDCVIRSLNRGMFEGTSLSYLFISSNVEDIQPCSLAGIKAVSISSKNPYIHSESDILKSGCAMSTDRLGSFDDRVFVFHSNVDRIPDREFFGNTSIREVSFSSCDVIRSIGQGSFAGSSLYSISIPSSVETIGEYCFSYCNLASVSFVSGSRLDSLPESCFEGVWIRSISIPRGVKVIGPSCFYDCCRLKSVSFDDDCLLTVMPDFLFCRTPIESITVPQNVREIGFQCFANSTLSSIEFCDRTSLKVIGNEAFRHTCLKSVTLPKTVIEIGDLCFSDISTLKTFMFCEGSELHHIGRSCFKRTSIKEIEIPPSVTEIGSDSLSDIEKVVIDEKNDHFISDGSFLLSKDGLNVHGCLRKMSCLNLPPNIVRVMDGAFRDSFILSVVIPNTLLSLGSESFSGCQMLETVTIPPKSRLKLVGNRCFAECRWLTNISLGNLLQLKSLSEEMFLHTRLLSIHVPKCVRVIRRRCFYRCSKLSSIEFEIGSRLKRIYEEAFSDCGLLEIHLPKSLVVLGDRVFAGCSHLKSVSFDPGSSIQYIGSNCFESECSIELPDTIYMLSPFSFCRDCEVVLNSDDDSIKDAFDEWNVHRDHCFVNPTREPNEIIKGALDLCDRGVLGSGAQGVVKLKQNMITGEILAVKVIDYRTFRGQFTDSLWDTMKCRAKEMEVLQHPCLVKVKGCCFDDDRHQITVCMEYVKGPSLDESCCSSSVNLKTVLEQQPSWWTKCASAIVVLGIARGLDQIHNQRLVHRDLKPSNVLIDEEFHPKICDFDVGRSIDECDDSGSMTLSVGTLKYMAPECEHGKYSPKSDYYSFGVLLYDIFEGINAIPLSFVLSPDVTFSDKTPEKIQEFIKDCLIAKPECRCEFPCESSEDGASPLFSAVYRLVCEHMGLDRSELMSIEAFVDKMIADENTYE